MKNDLPDILQLTTLAAAGDMVSLDALVTHAVNGNLEALDALAGLYERRAPGVEAVLLARAKTDDPVAWEALLQPCRVKIERRIRKTLGPQRADADVDDVMQRVCLALPDALLRYRYKASFCTFVVQIGYRQAQRYLQENGWDRLRPMNPKDAGGFLALSVDDRRNPESSWAESEHARHVLSRLFEKLEDEDSRLLLAFKYRFVDGCSAKEISEILDVSKQKVYQWIHHIRTLAREINEKLVQEIGRA